MKLVSGGSSSVNSSIQVSSSAIGSGLNVVFSKRKERQLYLRLNNEAKLKVKNKRLIPDGTLGLNYFCDSLLRRTPAWQHLNPNLVGRTGSGERAVIVNPGRCHHQNTLALAEIQTVPCPAEG